MHPEGNLIQSKKRDIDYVVKFTPLNSVSASTIFSL